MKTSVHFLALLFVFLMGGGLAMAEDTLKAATPASVAAPALASPLKAEAPSSVAAAMAESPSAAIEEEQHLPPFGTLMANILASTGIYDVIQAETFPKGWGRVVMILVSLLLIYLAIVKGFEPLLLLPIAFGALLCNIPLAGMAEEGGLIYYTYKVGISSGVFPLLIFLGIGAMTDFGPMIANPKTLLLGGAAQFGIFGSLVGAIALSECFPSLVHYSFKDAASIAIIGGADGPTAIYLASKLSPDLLGSIAVAAYSYMALVPLIQPPIMKFCTTKEERLIRMKQLRKVSSTEKIVFPILLVLLMAALLPSAAPLMGTFALGNLMRECGVVERLSDTAQNTMINIVTIFLGLSVGSKLSAESFLNMKTLGILLIGVTAFGLGTAAGVLMAKFMNLFCKEKINPLIGSAGVSAVPMAARVSQVVGLKADPRNYLLMHAMGPNVAGVIGSAVAAGILLAVFGAK